jgi:hypothetical protein
MLLSGIENLLKDVRPVLKPLLHRDAVVSRIRAPLGGLEHLHAAHWTFGVG